MKARRLFGVALFAFVLMLIAGSGPARGAPPGDPLSPAGTAFTYQGELQDAGGPVNGACDLRFTLWNAANAGSQVGNTLTHSGVVLANGLFTAELDFGSSAFQGSARWLQVGARCPAGSGSYTWLAPRQALTASPYALYALKASWSGLKDVPPGLNDGDDDTLRGLSCASGHLAEWNGSVWVCGDHAGGAHDHWGGSWGGPGIGLVLTSSNNIGLYGAHDASSGTEPGVKGETESSSGSASGVVGLVSSTSPGFHSAGVRGINQGTLSNGIGVYGEQKGSGSGVYGTSPNGKGVFGYATGDSGGSVGVEGRSNSPDGIGVFGKHVTTAGTEPGVKGETYSKDAHASGVLGVVVSNKPGAWSVGVKGINNGNAGLGIGVYGEQQGSGWGVFGTSASGYAGWFDGSVYVAGSCVNCVMAFVGLNSDSSPLESGDLVAIRGVSEPLAGANVPLLRVERATANNAGALVGVVHSRGYLAGTQGGPGEEIDNVVYAKGAAAPGDFLFIAVQGLVKVKADAGAGAIQAGETLALDRTAAGRAARAPDSSGGQQIGRAMEDLAEGRGLIWVMVYPQHASR
jgi:hypothetical protein